MRPHTFPSSFWKALPSIASTVREYQPARAHQISPHVVPACHRLKPQLHSTFDDALDELRQSFRKSALQGLVAKPRAHPLYWGWHLLSGTTWTADEPTAVRLLALMLRPASPASRLLLWQLLGPNAGVFSAKDRKAVSKLADHDIDVEVEVAQDNGSSTKRRADLVLWLRVRNNSGRPVRWLVVMEAKIQHSGSVRQLADLRQLFKKWPHDRACFIYLTPPNHRFRGPGPIEKHEHQGSEDPKKLPSGWKQWYWHDVVAAMERVLPQIPKTPKNRLFRSWFGLALGSFWAGTLGVEPSERQNELALLADASVQDVRDSRRGAAK